MRMFNRKNHPPWLSRVLLMLILLTYMRSVV